MLCKRTKICFCVLRQFSFDMRDAFQQLRGKEKYSKHIQIVDRFYLNIDRKESEI